MLVYISTLWCKVLEILCSLTRENSPKMLLSIATDENHISHGLSHMGKALQYCIYVYILLRELSVHTHTHAHVCHMHTHTHIYIK